MSFNVNKAAGPVIARITPFETAIWRQFTSQTYNPDGSPKATYTDTTVTIQKHNIPQRPTVLDYNQLETRKTYYSFFVNGLDAKAINRSVESGGDFLIYDGFEYKIEEAYSGTGWQKLICILRGPENG